MLHSRGEENCFISGADRRKRFEVYMITRASKKNKKSSIPDERRSSNNLGEGQNIAYFLFQTKIEKRPLLCGPAVQVIHVMRQSIRGTERGDHGWYKEKEKKGGRRAGHQGQCAGSLRGFSAKKIKEKEGAHHQKF